MLFLRYSELRTLLGTVQTSYLCGFIMDVEMWVQLRCSMRSVQTQPGGKPAAPVAMSGQDRGGTPPVTVGRSWEQEAFSLLTFLWLQPL